MPESESQKAKKSEIQKTRKQKKQKSRKPKSQKAESQKAARACMTRFLNIKKVGSWKKKERKKNPALFSSDFQLQLNPGPEWLSNLERLQGTSEN